MPQLIMCVTCGQQFPNEAAAAQHEREKRQRYELTLQMYGLGDERIEREHYISISGEAR